jgi:lipopolysaccharide transport system permease protein
MSGIEPRLAHGTPLDGTTAPHVAITVISAHRGWFDWRLGQLWRYRDLIALFVWRDFVAVYKQTILGPLWHLIKPLITTLIFTVVFSRVAGLPTDGVPPFLFYMVGNITWAYFSNTLDNTAKTFMANVSLLGKVYFHRLVIPVSLVFSNLIAFGIQFTIFVVTLLLYRAFGTTLSVGWALMLAPFLLVLMAGYALSIGIIICALTTRYRDLNHLITFGLQLLMYLSPVIYPVSAIPEQYRWAAMLNPLTPIFEGFRVAFLGAGTVSPFQLAVSTALMLVLGVVGLVLFTRVEQTFMDTV